MTVMTTPRAGDTARLFSFNPDDDTKVKPLAPAPEPVTAIRVSAQADPNILARIVQPMVKLDLLPRYFHVLSRDGGEMLAEIAFAGADETQVERFRNTLRSVIGVGSVELI